MAQPNCNFFQEKRAAPQIIRAHAGIVPVVCQFFFIFYLLFTPAAMYFQNSIKIVEIKLLTNQETEKEKPMTAPRKTSAETVGTPPLRET
jgi:hypothetical protein